MKKETKYCEDCKYISVDPTGLLKFSKCLHESSHFYKDDGNSKYSLISKKYDNITDRKEYAYCYTVRRKIYWFDILFFNRCGGKARHFEPKEKE